MTERTLLGGLLALVVLFLPGVGQASYDVDEYQWCYNNMPRFYDENFQACVDSNCDRISNKKVSQKRACYRRCTGEVVGACMTKRAKGPVRSSPKTVSPLAKSSGESADTQPVTRQAPLSPSEKSPAENRREDGFLSRMWRGITGDEESEKAAPAASAGDQSTLPPVNAVEGEGKRRGFFDQLADSFGEGAGNLNADYKWCRDQSGVYQEYMRDCSRGCMAGPSASGSRRQACLRSCKVDGVDACIKARDGR